MNGRPELDEQVRAFLRGERAHVASVERAVRGTVRSFRLGNADLERDLIQETLSRTIASLSGGRFQREASLPTYARNVARYTCLEHLRRRRHEVAFEPDLCAAGERWAAPEASYLTSEEVRLHLEAFASLPADCRELLAMIAVEGLSYREAAARLGISEATLKSRVHRCRLTCREAAKHPTRPRWLVLGKAAP